jgi:hypothetical protein
MPVRDIARKSSFWCFVAVLTVVLIVGVGVALSAALRAYSGAEQRYYAENQLALTHIAISRGQQHALTRAQRRARGEIRVSLTAHHLQYEAIRAQRAVGVPAP